MCHLLSFSLSLKFLISVHIVTLQESKPVFKLAWNPVRSAAVTYLSNRVCLKTCVI